MLTALPSNMLQKLADIPWGARRVFLTALAEISTSKLSSITLPLDTDTYSVAAVRSLVKLDLPFLSSAKITGKALLLQFTSAVIKSLDRDLVLVDLTELYTIQSKYSYLLYLKFKPVVGGDTLWISPDDLRSYLKVPVSSKGNFTANFNSHNYGVRGLRSKILVPGMTDLKSAGLIVDMDHQLTGHRIASYGFTVTAGLESAPTAIAVGDINSTIAESIEPIAVSPIVPDPTPPIAVPEIEKVVAVEIKVEAESEAEVASFDFTFSQPLTVKRRDNLVQSLEGGAGLWSNLKQDYDALIAVYGVEGSILYLEGARCV